MRKQFLLFQLYGPLASWGGIAVGDQRPSFDRPSKSAIVGLLAAALGLRRPDWRLAPEEAELLDRQHRALADYFYLALQVEAQGVYLKDYHTVQVPEGGPYPSRTSELQRVRPGSGGKQTYREYYAGMRAIVCLSERVPGGEPVEIEGEPLTLDRVCRCIERPGFLLYLGRKACPPALPLTPYVDDTASDFGEALEKAARLYRQQIDQLTVNRKNGLSELLTAAQPRVFWDHPEEWEPGSSHTLVQRRDEIGSRHRWQFQPRQEKTITRESP